MLRAAIIPTRASACAINVWPGTTRLTSPILSASSAVTISPVKIISAAFEAPTARDNLSYVSVEVEQVGDLAAFEQYVGAANRKAAALAGYQAAGHPDGPNSYAYTAQEHGATYRYDDRYWFKNNHAIHLRCARPERSVAGAAWAASFDRGCGAVATSLAR